MNKAVQDESFCAQCKKYHPLHYTVDCKYQKHLVLECPLGMKAIAFVPNLNVPTRESKRLTRTKAQLKQTTLL